MTMGIQSKEKTIPNMQDRDEDIERIKVIYHQDDGKG